MFVSVQLSLLVELTFSVKAVKAELDRIISFIFGGKKNKKTQSAPWINPKISKPFSLVTVLALSPIN